MAGTAAHINSGKSLEELPEFISCQYIGGACMVFRSSLINEIGYIPEKYFLFYEETEWCYKALKAGYKNVILGHTSIIHKGSESIDKIGGLSSYLLERNRAVFVKKNLKPKVLFPVFVIINSLRILTLSVIRGREYLSFFSYMNDGIKGKIRKEYSFVKIRE